MVPVVVDETRDLDLVSALLAQAFADDPVVVWLHPDRSRHLPLFRTLVRRSHGVNATFDLALRDGQPVGAAAWDPPGHKISARAQVLSTLEFMRALGSRAMRGMKLEEEFARRRPKEPHWYLGQVGTPVQGAGIGSALLRHRLERIEGPAYLESSNALNVPLYERFGFEVTEEFELPDDGPKVWAMYRPMR
ncbi:GNAT family N-acetyltransferase [Gordonia paraffinivorans]|uniref:GNAT family N-acetyltransferase n=1 Tax=Gordonia paraffinivorans TaxID=175628 RepID=UPI000D61A136|nr:GNAT family N-acetyltransferase [Gordonia paraffinivorans]PWD41943.1 GNAT family N-acetyltransferase [Gordonia paraffinivorans]